jgi:hypothetical protein
MKHDISNLSPHQLTLETPARSTLANEFFGRLLTLSDGQPGLRGSLKAHIEEPQEAEGKPIIDFLCSDETLDRYDEIITASGWRLENYRQNPVFQNAHQYGDVLFTLGRALATEVRAGSEGAPGALFQRVEFAVEINPLARIAYGLYRGGFLNAVSVGLIPIRWENGTPGAAFRRRYLEQELLEVSAVSIPANPHALQLGLKAGAVEKSDLRDLAAMLRGMMSTRCRESEFLPTLCGGGASNGAHLLQLANAVKRLLQRL